MKRKLSPWCKEVKKTLIDRDMSVTELCGEVGMCRNYVTTDMFTICKDLASGELEGFQMPKHIQDVIDFLSQESEEVL